jgi:hypothetical protein
MLTGGRTRRARKSSIFKVFGLKTALTVAGNHNLRVKKNRNHLLIQPLEKLV